MKGNEMLEAHLKIVSGDEQSLLNVLTTFESSVRDLKQKKKIPNILSVGHELYRDGELVDSNTVLAK